MSDKTATFIEKFEKLKEKTSHYDTNEITSNLYIVQTKFNDTRKLQENRRFAKRFILNSLDRNIVTWQIRSFASFSINVSESVACSALLAN